MLMLGCRHQKFVLKWILAKLYLVGWLLLSLQFVLRQTFAKLVTLGVMLLMPTTVGLPGPDVVPPGLEDNGVNSDAHPGVVRPDEVREGVPNELE